MKYLFRPLILITLILVLVNCSNDDDNSSQRDNIRLKTYTVDGTEYNIIYNENGQLISYESPLGLINTIYNAEGKIIQIADRSYSYDSEGRLSEISINDGSDTEAQLIYNSDSLLARVNFSYIQNNGIQVNVQQNYIYNDQGKLIETQEDSSFARFKDLLTYDDQNNIVQIRQQSRNSSGDFEDFRVIGLVYDNAKNPGKLLLKSMGIESAITPFYTIENFYTVGLGEGWDIRSLFTSQNNVLFLDDSSRTFERNYNYNEYGYPDAMDETKTFDNGFQETRYYSWTYETY